ncbi:hypothetical protein SCORR_v1c02680 [Spiroplasma corruscae]|uniref:Bacteriocin ABC transporter n=1 Tax=Spiroplasma corruscae TaxID=216934 RepID=A0A222ENH5_9MOLU|nr:ATP-binding cassette domain-containing protein [Spiroplasma corruscae]ASP28042.1 hypothetical protein SCORR_v1c02680 [Spiroplasma corruscae]
MSFRFQTQTNENDCGVAVSSMLINFYCKKNYTLEEVRYVNNISNEMLSMYDIENILLNYGIEFTSYSCSFEELLTLDFNKPILLNILNAKKEEHFILCLKKSKDKFLVADPVNKDIKWESIEHIKKHYQGYIGISKLVKKIIFKNKKLVNWFTYLSNYKVFIYFTLFLSLIINFFIILNSNFLKKFISEININDIEYKNKFFLVFIFFSTVEIIVTFILKVFINKLKNRLRRNIFQDYRDKLMSLSIEKFHSNKKEVWLKKISYINDIVDFVVDFTITLPIEFLLFLLTLIILINISPVILILMLIDNFFIIIVSIFFTTLLKDKYIRFEQRSIKFSKKVREFVDSFEEIKYKGIKKKFQKDLNLDSIDLYNSSDELIELKTKISVINNFINTFFYYLIFYTSYLLILKNNFSVTELLFYTSISIHINSFFNNLNAFACNMQNYRIASSNLFFLFEDVFKSKSSTFIEKVDKIEFINIYKYISSKKCINNFNYSFKGNTFVYGRSGSGKTSILKLISGHLESYEGKILINDKDFQEININDYQNKIMYLGQYDYIFDGTVWANIQQFKNKIDMNIFKTFNFFEILKNNCIDINKEIYDNGNNLSKGQRQIINFISLFFTNKDVYLIDEPLSNVEKDTAYYLFKTFYEYKKKSLIIMCDHDLTYKNFFPNRVEVSS